MRNARPKRGTALIIVLGVLAVLSLLATAFSTLAATERAVTRNYLDTVRARLLAQSGVEAAVARLRETAWRTGLAADTAWQPVDATRPSFALDGAITIDGRPAGLSGHMETGAYASRGDIYTLRITDSSSQINVNNGLSWGPDHSVSRNLRRILNVLGALPTIDVPGLGDKVLAARPPAGYLLKADIFRALAPDAVAWRRVRDFLTVDSWSDPGVANPVPLSASVSGPPFYRVDFHRPGGLYRWGHQKNAKGELINAPLLFHDPANAIWGRDSLSPQWIEIVSRSPVNVNTARREVLMALLIDLEGFFLVERRRVTPGGYAWADTHYTYDAAGNEGDECGFITRTLPITGPRAEAIVDEILACRARRPSPRIAELDYAAVPFGGPFRSWAQFNLFVDALVQGGVLIDNRSPLFWDLGESGQRLAGAPLQLRLAAQAIGDVLKANFNPNLHLNEINPNRNLFAHVDKTDLLVHSTEFCFAPMGTFEIESTGRVLRPAGDDAFVSVATARVLAHVRLYDAVRETSQRDFYAGEIADRRPGPETNNNRSLETGPEPDNGPAPAENRAEGWLQLPTYGSNLTARGRHKPPGALWTTLSDPAYYPGAATMTAPAAGHLGAAVHAHFQLDHVAHHHASRNPLTSPSDWDGFRLPQGAWWGVFGDRACINANYEDRGEKLRPPYGPVASPDRFRLARSFTLPDVPAKSEFTPGDLRLDGAYVERHSAFGYWMDEDVSFNFNAGTAAFWIKPGFFPEMTGKSRTLLSASRYHAQAPGLLNPSPFALFLLPAGDDSITPLYSGGAMKFRSNSLAFGLGFSGDTGYNREMGGTKAAATHAFAFSPSPLRAHEWTHVAVTWKNVAGDLPTEETVRIYVNGRVMPGAVGMAHLYPAGTHEGQPFGANPAWSVHSLQALLPGFAVPKWCANTIRLGGEPSLLFDRPSRLLFPRNFSADATFDEFYLWTDRSRWSHGGLTGIETLWSRGRYYKPDDTDPADARFTSRKIDVPSFGRRYLPPAAGPGGVEAPSCPRLIGIAWTEIAEDYDRTGTSMRPKMYDGSSTPPLELRPAAATDANGFKAETMADLHVEVGGLWFGPFRNETWSAVRGPSGAPPEVAEESGVRYRAKLKMGGPVSPGTILLSTPVLDDVTIFYERDGVEILGYALLAESGS